MVMRISIKCRKKATKIILIDHLEKRKIIQEYNKLMRFWWKPRTWLKRGKRAWSSRDCVFILHLIGWGGGASFLDQSQGLAMQNQVNQFDT